MLVFLSRPVSRENLNLVTLDSRDDLLAPGDSLFVAGWGDVAPGNSNKSFFFALLSWLTNCFCSLLLFFIEIAFEFCPFDTSASFAPPSRPDYKEACREVASGICEGAVGNQVNDNGCSLTTSELLMLQDKCEYQVNLMTGGDNGGWIEPLPEPVPFSPPGNW